MGCGKYKMNVLKSMEFIEVVTLSKSKILKKISNIDVSNSGVEFMNKFSSCQLNNYDDCFLRENLYRDQLFEHLSSGSYKSFKHFSELNFELLDLVHSFPELLTYHWAKQLGDQDTFENYAGKISSIFEMSLKFSTHKNWMNFSSYFQPKIIKRFERISDIKEIPDLYDEMLIVWNMNS